MNKKDFNRVVSAHTAGVSAEVCVAMILDINWKRAMKLTPVSYLTFKAECQRDIPFFYKTIGQKKT